jgi:RNA polymerase sigma-70 factor (family 1)
MPSKKLFYPQAGDFDLFTLVKESDERAFEELYNRHWPVLFNIACKRLNSKQKAEDIVQNIFIDLYRRRTTIELTISLSAYLRQALKFKIINEYRSAVNRNKYQKSLFLKGHCKIDFSDPLEAKDLEMKINTILNQLPEKCKQAFLLSREENLSYKDISIGLSITVSTVEKHISKALKTLRCQI